MVGSESDFGGSEIGLMVFLSRPNMTSRRRERHLRETKPLGVRAILARSRPLGIARPGKILGCCKGAATLPHDCFDRCRVGFDVLHLRRAPDIDPPNGIGIGDVVQIEAIGTHPRANVVH